MTITTATIGRRVLLALAAAALTGCAASPAGGPGALPSGSSSPTAALTLPSIPPATKPAQPLPAPHGGRRIPLPRLHVAWSNPSSVSAAALTVMYTMDTSADTSQYQAELRAAPYLSPTYLAQLRAAPPVSAPGAQWDTWTAHQATTTVKLTAEHTDQPPGTASTTYRQWGITATPEGTHHWRGQPLTATAFVTLTKISGRWLVSAVTVSS